MLKFGVRKHAIKTNAKSTKLTFWSESVFSRYVKKCQILNSNDQMATSFNLKPLKHNLSDSLKKTYKKQAKINKHDPHVSANVIHNSGARSELLEGPQTTLISNMPLKPC